MLLLLFAATAATPVAAAIDPVQADARNAKCPPISRYEAARRGGKLRPSLLNELPSADLYKAVYRRIGGCIAPVVVRYGVGSR